MIVLQFDTPAEYEAFQEGIADKVVARMKGATPKRISFQDACKELGISPDTLDRKLRKHEIPRYTNPHGRGKAFDSKYMLLLRSKS